MEFTSKFNFKWANFCALHFFFYVAFCKFWTLNTVIFDRIWKWLTHAYAHPPSWTHACTELAAGVQVCQWTKTHLLLFALTAAAICSQSHMSQLDKLEQKPLWNSHSPTYDNIHMHPYTYVHTYVQNHPYTFTYTQAPASQTGIPNSNIQNLNFAV